MTRRDRSIRHALDTLADVVRSPLCVYQRHCGAIAALGPPEPDGYCVNRSIQCLRCGATGVSSTNLKLSKQEKKEAV